MIRKTVPELMEDFKESGPDFTVINGGEFFADPGTEGVTNETSVCCNLSSNEYVILGT